MPMPLLFAVFARRCLTPRLPFAAAERQRHAAFYADVFAFA
jgi:hypothetical protein